MVLAVSTLTTGVPRSTMLTSHGYRISTVVISIITSIRPISLGCVLFGLFNNLRESQEGNILNTISNNTVYGNTGGISICYCDPIVTGNHIVYNYDYKAAGGLSFYPYDIPIENIVGNTICGNNQGYNRPMLSLCT